MSRHEGVSCDNCLASNFRRKRFKCLVCYDYDLCEACHQHGVSTSRHLKTHPMQCILTRNEFDLFYAGEGLSVDSPPSFTCPLCGVLGFSDTALQEHVNAGHQDNTSEVVCPICAALPSGDPNHMTDDFATHLAIEHHGPNREPEEQSGRHARRMFYPGRGMRGGRSHRAVNMHFGDGPSSNSSASSNSNPSLSGPTLTSVRDSMDPIAELLSQLSGVRHNPHLQQSVSTATQLQELHTQLQFERQRASILRQQLERVPPKTQSSQNGSNQAANSAKTFSEAIKAGATPKLTAVQHKDNEDDPRFLLPRLDGEKLSESEEKIQATESVEMSYFVRDLLMVLEDFQSDNETTDIRTSSEASQIVHSMVDRSPSPVISLAVAEEESKAGACAKDSSYKETEITHATRQKKKDGSESENIEDTCLNDASNDDVIRKSNLLSQQRDNNSYESNNSSRTNSSSVMEPSEVRNSYFSGRYLLASNLIPKN